MSQPGLQTSSRSESRGRLHDKVAVITGSSSGIGRAIALSFAEQGTKLIVCVDLQPAPRSLGGTLQDKASWQESKPTHEVISDLYGVGKACFVACDVSIGAGEWKEKEEHGEEHNRGETSKVAMIGAAIRKAVNLMGRLDIMVNNAGIGMLDIKLHEMTEAEWDKAMSVNARGAFLGSKHAIAQFLTQTVDSTGTRGIIINTTSVGGLVGLFECSAYCASKAAIIGLTRATTVEYAAKGIRCNALCPGYVQTAMISSFLTDSQFSSYLDMVIPAQEVGKPHDMAGAAVWLASSEESRYVNGIVLPVDGGFTAR